MTCNERTGLAARRYCLATLTLLALLPAAISHADVYSDDFTGNWPYSLDLPNGIWTGTHNMSALNGGLFEASPVDGDGKLVVDNLAGQSYGWSGGDSNAPLLFFEVDGAADWTAQVTIDAQTNIGYSGAGFVARAKTGVTPGPGSINEFVAFYSFRYWDAAANPAEDANGSTLLKRIGLNNVDGSDVQWQHEDIINPGFGTSLPDAALPNLLRLVRTGNTFTGYISLDEGATWLNQGSVEIPAGTPLADPTIPVEFGLAYQTFVGNAGQARFDDFSLETTTRVPEPTTAGMALAAVFGLVGFVRRRSA